MSELPTIRSKLKEAAECFDERISQERTRTYPPYWFTDS
jgi:hypothetical protein